VNINTTKIISLLFFIFSAFYLYTAYQIQVFAFDENAPFNAKTFPIYLGYAGLFFSGLKLILPDPETIKVEHKNLEYKKNSNINYYCNYLWSNNFKNWIFFNYFIFFIWFLLFFR
jgi:putative tricarboxylic transport membrane protein